MKEILSAINANHNSDLTDRFAALKKQSIIYRLIILTPIIALILLPAFGYSIDRQVGIAIALLPAAIVLFNQLIKMDKKIDILFELIISQQENMEIKKDGINKQS